MELEAFHTSEATRREFLGEDALVFARYPRLTQPSEPHPALVIKLAGVLDQMLLTGDGAAQSFGDRVTGTREPGAPRSDLLRLLEEFLWRFDRCRSSRDRLLLIKDAEAALVVLRYAPDRSKVRGTPEWRQAIAADPRSCRDLAAIYGVHYATISRIKKAGR